MTGIPRMTPQRSFQKWWTAFSVLGVDHLHPCFGAASDKYNGSPIWINQYAVQCPPSEHLHLLDHIPALLWMSSLSFLQKSIGKPVFCIYSGTAVAEAFLSAKSLQHFQPIDPLLYNLLFYIENVKIKLKKSRFTGMPHTLNIRIKKDNG